MKIEYLLEDEEGNHISKFANIEVFEDSTLQELIMKLHEEISLPLYKELKYENEIVKVYFSHFVKCSEEPYDYDYIDDSSKKKVKDYPKGGQNGVFCIYIEEGAGLVN